MPVNKNALLRYRTIDQCLVNRQRRWTLLDLMNACSEALYELEGIDKPVSRRTIQLDLQMMRSDRLGYCAPIIVVEQKYYTYEDPNFSIFNLPLSEQDLSRLSEVVNMLKQFKGFSHFQDLEGMVKKLEDKVEVAQKKRNPIIDFDRNEDLKGLEHLDPAYQAILEKRVLKVIYHPFWQEEPNILLLHPYLLKEYNNRWYIVGFHHDRRKISLLGLERIVQMETTNRVAYIENNFFNPTSYFKEVIGMTVDLKGEAKEILLYILAEKAPYVLTKPLHPSQKLVAEFGGGIIISLHLKLNYELRGIISSLGHNALVLKPTQLRLGIELSFERALSQYRDKKFRGQLWAFLNQLESKENN